VTVTALGSVGARFRLRETRITQNKRRAPVSGTRVQRVHERVVGNNVAADGASGIVLCWFMLHVLTGYRIFPGEY
jgi:hypothetical protein